MTTRARASNALVVRVALAAMVSAALLSPGVACADEPIAPEADTNPSTYPPPVTRWNLVLVGAAVTAGWYGAAVGTSYLWSDSDGASALRVPVAGPYMALAKTGCSDREPTCGTFDVVLRTIFTGLSAVGQTGGILAMLDGAFVPTASSPARDTTPLRRRESSARATQITVVPFSAGSGLGLGLLGNF
ncbi:MAG TPA: hypothetical protein VHE30_30330 [Polyangiaceae bacterium]|nr:hypothetical protein [Polyangiaceae bacterium]